MMRSLVGTALLLSLAVAATLARTGEPAPKKVADIRLKDSGGKTWALEDFKDRKAIVVVFLGTQCPINNAYLPRLVELHKQYADKGVQFLAINSNEHDTPEAVAEHAKRFGIPFP